jgi:hypothetical protein
MDIKTLEQELKKETLVITLEDLEGLFPESSKLIREIYSGLGSISETAYAVLIASLYDHGGFEIIKNYTPKLRDRLLFDERTLNEQRIMRAKRNAHGTPHNPDYLIPLFEEDIYWDKKSSGQLGAGPTHVPNHRRTSGRNNRFG